MFGLFLLACAPTEILQTCDVAEGPVEDETASLDLGVSVGGLVAQGSGRTLDLVDLAGLVHAVTLTIVRTDEAATLVDRTVVEQITKPGNENRFITSDFDGSCVDELTVPVTFTLADTEGAVAVVATGTLYAEDSGTPDSSVAIDATFDPAVSTLPTGFHAGPVAGVLRGALFTGAGPTVAVWVAAADGAREAVLASSAAD